MENEKDFQTRTNESAHAAIASMRDDIDALEHARECNGKTANGRTCKRGSETRTFTVEGRKIKQLLHSSPEAWHDEDIAREQIEQGHYGVTVRSGWTNPGEPLDAEEYCVTLGSGGPASRITGDLDRGSPTTANYEFQDWFKPWTPANDLSQDEEATLLDWVGHLYFGD